MLQSAIVLNTTSRTGVTPQGDPESPGWLSHLSSEVQTGDLLLFSGKGLASGIVRFFTRSRWTHVGMVVRLPGWREPLVVEATTSGECVDVLHRRPVPGVSLVTFRERVAGYDGVVALRRRRGDPIAPCHQRMLRRLLARLCHRPYKNYVVALVREWLTGRDHSGWFCSELVAEIYQRLGWLPRHRPANLFVPAHFGDDLPLRSGELTDPEIICCCADACPTIDAPVPGN